VPEELFNYLERDQGIGAAWATPQGFQLSDLAALALDV